MATVKVMKRYQIVIPKDVRKKTKIREGDLVMVEYVGGKIEVTPLGTSSQEAVKETYGALRRISHAALEKALKAPEEGLVEEK